jgi:hypothetical protein
MVERWGAIEADFHRHYQIHQPLQIGYRKFIRLLSNLPFDKSSFYLPMYRAAQEGQDYTSNPEEIDRRYYKRQLDKVRGREGKQRKQISLEQFMKETHNG